MEDLILYLPIRSINFYYPEFQAANVRIFRDKSKICFLEPTWSNLVKFRGTHGKTRTTERHVITAPRVIGQDAPTTLDTTGCGPVGQANATLTPFGALPVVPSDGRSQVGSSDPGKPVLRGVDHCHCVPLLGLIGEGGQRYRHRSSEFLAALRRHLPG